MGMFWQHPEPNTNWERVWCYQCIQVSTVSVLCANRMWPLCSPSGTGNSQLSEVSPALPGFSLAFPLKPVKRPHYKETMELFSLPGHTQAQRGWVTCPRSHSWPKGNHPASPQAPANLFRGLLPLSFFRKPLRYYQVLTV